MVAALSYVRPESGERRIVIHGVRWRDYVIAREALDAPGVRMTYLKGALEIMAPSPEHETAKTTSARLIETYAFLARLPLNGYGSTTFRREAKQRGAEPDECWVVGRTLEAAGGFPDIVFEVIETTPLVDKLEVYDGFGIPEVWIFEDGAFTIHRRKASGGYVLATKSALLPELDFRRIAKLAAMKDQQSALELLERGMRDTRKPKRPRRRT
ncbi:MAG: Uma2 family endonuclease [Labilithrix sp.]|nr:Uma2 family endonuclease [Labilithrix sp.]MCW5810225.1 Uma2 family endonuclease [Labilithrix sp.]